MREIAERIKTLLDRVIAHEGDLIAFHTREPEKAEELLKLLDFLEGELEDLLWK